MNDHENTHAASAAGSNIPAELTQRLRDASRFMSKVGFAKPGRHRSREART